MPREVLAEWITRKDNPFFARATVNRVWAYFLGIGLIDPVDEMVGADYPASHPELLDELARDFAAHDFDLKYLILAITSSKAYQLEQRQDPPEPGRAAPLRAGTAAGHDSGTAVRQRGRGDPLLGCRRRVSAAGRSS